MPHDAAFHLGPLFTKANGIFIIKKYNLCYFCLVLLCFHARLFVDALWSPAGEALTSWLSFVLSNCDVVTFPLVGQMWCLIVSIPDLCPLSYFIWKL